MNPSSPKILAFAGSTRVGSLNKKFIRVGADAAAAAGAEVTRIDLRDLPMPLYDGDLEAADGIPENARRFKELLKANDGLLICTPEYNSSIPGVLKNAIDWASRTAEGEKPLVCFQGKVAALMAASPGQLGGLRSLVTLRSILGNIGVLVLPTQVALPKADEAFTPEGALVDPKRAAAISKLAAELVDVVSKLRG